MRLRILMVAVSVLFLSSPAWAQTDFFGGYSFVRLGSDFGNEVVHGWMANANFDVADPIGIVADVSGFYEDGVSAHTYTGGVRANFRTDSGVNPFAQALFGGITFSGGGSSESGFAMGFGGGVDVPIADTVSVRAVQFDYVPFNVFDTWVNDNIRLGWGIVFHVD